MSLKPDIHAVKLGQVAGQQFAGIVNVVEVLVERLGMYRWLGYADQHCLRRAAQLTMATRSSTCLVRRTGTVLLPAQLIS